MGGDKKTTSVEAGIKHKPRTEESLLAWNPTPHTCIAADSFKDATKKPLHPDFPVKCTFKANKINDKKKATKDPKHFTITKQVSPITSKKCNTVMPEPTPPTNELL